MSLTITLKKCLSEANRVTKEFAAEADITLTGVFKKEQDFLNPEILVEGSANLRDYNYCYITELSRYYFIKPKVFRTNLWLLSCEVDVLMSWAVGIGNSDALVKRTEKDGMKNFYMNDSVFYTEQREVVTYHMFKKNGVAATIGTPSYYLVVAGGTASP